MDFEEFRRKKQQEKEAQELAKRQEGPTISGEKLDWVDGIGPVGPRNPKVKGFMLGRFRKAKIDPKTLKKPEGYENYNATGPSAKKTQGEIELERKRAQLAKMEEELQKAEEQRELERIAQQKKQDGMAPIKNRRRY